MAEKVKRTALSQLKDNDEDIQRNTPSPSTKVEKPQTVTKSDDEVYIRKFSIIQKDLDGEIFAHEYPRLKTALELGVHKISYAALLEAVDKVAENARIAGNLYVAAREEFERFEKVEYAIWWSDKYAITVAELEKKKKRQELSGQISDEKIRNYIMNHFNREYRAMNEKLIALRSMRDVLEVLYEQWRSRKSLLQTQGNLFEKRITITNGK